MHTIYIASGFNHASMEHCTEALRIQFPRQTFDCDWVCGFKGIRIHVETYDTEAPAVVAARTFAEGFKWGCLRIVGR